MKPCVVEANLLPTKTNLFSAYTKRVKSSLHTVITMRYIWVRSSLFRITVIIVSLPADNDDDHVRKIVQRNLEIGRVASPGDRLSHNHRALSYIHYRALGPELIPVYTVQAGSPQVSLSHPPGGRLPLLSARPAVTFPAEEHHRPSACTKLYYLVTEAHAVDQLARGCYLQVDRSRFWNPRLFLATSELCTVVPHQWSLINTTQTRYRDLRGRFVTSRTVSVQLNNLTTFL